MIDHVGITSKSHVLHAKKVINNDGGEILTYYINNKSGLDYLDRGYIDIDGWKYLNNHIQINKNNHEENEKEFIISIFEKLDASIDLDFELMNTNQGSDIDIYSVNYATSFSNNVVGQTIAQDTSYGAWVDILWKDISPSSFTENEKNNNRS